MNSFQLSFFGCLLSAICLMQSGCETSANSSITLNSGLVVECESDEGQVSQVFTGTQTTLTLHGQSLVVQQGQILIGDAVVAMIPPDAEKVRIVESSDKLTISIDGKSVYETPAQ